ncbi:E3 ubiquitin-protein ligase UBR4-like, partial [Saccoglossus kowalevskii]
MVLMSSAGYIYTQPMEELSSAKHGPFYVTNVLDVTHDDLKDTNGQVAGGGVSVYYSHTLQLLFFSYSQGKTFCASLNKQNNQLPSLFPINFKSNNGSSKSNSPALCQWNEVPNHPGLIYCITQTSGVPVIMMVKPDSIMVQEIKTLPAKAKIQDMVAIRHPSATSEQHRTTLILLCEDGSLRIYMASVENTSYWMSSQFQPASVISVLRPPKKKKTAKSGRPVGQVSFPIDFFEHSQVLNDVEYGGNDLLQLYNVQQIKHRMNTTGMYVASTKPTGFSIDVTNNNSNMVMVGVRFHIGTQSVERVPSFLEMFGRSVQINLSRNRWYDMPFTRDESLTADKKFTIFVGPSVDPAGVTMLDSIKVYGKTKEAFGWPDEPPDEFPSVTGTNLPTVTTSTDTEVAVTLPLPLTSLDRLVASSLEVLEGCFMVLANTEVWITIITNYSYHKLQTL